MTRKEKEKLDILEAFNQSDDVLPEFIGRIFSMGLQAEYIREVEKIRRNREENSELKLSKIVDMKEYMSREKDWGGG